MQKIYCGLNHKNRIFSHSLTLKLSQTSCLSQISQIISVEKNLSCGEISDFCKEFEQFMEFYRNLCRFCSKFVWRKSLWRKNDKYEVCLKSLWNIFNWEVITRRRRKYGVVSHLGQRESNRSVHYTARLGFTIDLLLHFLALDVLHALMWGEKKCDFAMQAITSGWHLGLENLGGWSWMRKILFETLSELPRAPLLLHICHVGICHILNLAFNYAKFRNTSRRRWTFLKNFATVNKANLLPSRFNLIEVKFLEGRYL